MADRKKSKKPNTDSTLTTDIASFASSLGLSTAASPPSSAGFNDVDFRSAPNKPNPKSSKPHKPANPKPQTKPIPTPTKQPPFPDVTHDNNKSSTFENLPKLPLVSPVSIGVWYEEADELEAKLGVKAMKRVEARSEAMWGVEVGKRRKLAERLMAQYTGDYEGSKGRSGDIKLLLTTQRSGTASDKISAFSVLVGDDPIANLRSLDALLGMVASKVGKRYAFAGFDALRELFLTRFFL